MSEPTRDPIGPFEHAVLALFDDVLAEVRFPDVDHAALESARRATLDAEIALERVEDALESARRTLSERHADLGKLARKAVAYARVLAEDDPSLAAKLDALAPRSPEPTERAPKRRRARAESTAMLPTMASEELAAE